MMLLLEVDRAAVAQICRSRSVQRLSMFGSALTDRFDAERSDVDLLVEFEPEVVDVFEAYFGLKDDLEALLGRTVDLVMRTAVRNPFFEAEVFGRDQELYAA